MFFRENVIWNEVVFRQKYEEGIIVKSESVSKRLTIETRCLVTHLSRGVSRRLLSCHALLGVRHSRSLSKARISHSEAREKEVRALTL